MLGRCSQLKYNACKMELRGIALGLWDVADRIVRGGGLSSEISERINDLNKGLLDFYQETHDSFPEILYEMHRKTSDVASQIKQDGGKRAKEISDLAENNYREVSRLLDCTSGSDFIP